jgi:hypothetical protein
MHGGTRHETSATMWPFRTMHDTHRPNSSTAVQVLHRSAARLALSALLAVILASVATDWPNRPTAAAEACTMRDEVGASTCRLVDGQTVEGMLEQPRGSATYRVDALAPDATLELVLAGRGGSTVVTVLDWHGRALGEALRADAAPDVRLSVKLPLPGVYGVRVRGDAPPESPGFRLSTSLSYPDAAMRPVWPPALAGPDGALVGERRLIRTPRGGTPAAGLALATFLGTPPEAAVDDFTLVADVQFEKIVGPAAATVRFRYEPEAGGGTGYLLSLNPFAGTVSLDTFDEGQRRSIVDDLPLPDALTGDGPNRLVLTADGAAIRATLDGLPIVETADARYTKGLIAIGAVTWSDPVAVTFDHIQVASPSR